MQRSSGPDRQLQLDGLLDAMVGDGLIESERAHTLKRVATEKSRRETHPLLEVARRGWHHAQDAHTVLTAELLTRWLANRHGMPYRRIDPLKIDVPAVTAVMGYNYANHFDLLAVAVDARAVTVACTDPIRDDWREELEQVIHKTIIPVLANPEDVARFRLEFYSLARSVGGAAQQQSNSANNYRNLEQLMELGRQGKLDANDQHVVNLVDWLLHYAFEQRASDIHLEPRREHGDVRFRIDGVLHLVYQLPPQVLTAMTSRIKILGRMDVAEKRRPQDGRLKTRSPVMGEVELRLSTMPTASGEKLVLRIFDPAVLMRDFAQLGLDPNEEARWEELIQQPNGLLLVTGPTGSGKTTTLYSTLRRLAAPEVNVCTVEDPIELIEPRFNQMQVQHNIDLTFASGVRTLLRQDPDIIMVGEIRDQETASMAIQAALTGHLVLSSLHTNDAPAALTRLLDLGVPPYLIGATLIGVLAQRLVRTICPHCAQEQPCDPVLWKQAVDPWPLPPPPSLSSGAGCLECRQTGFQGRKGIYEMLVPEAGLRQQIERGLSADRVRRLALKSGMRPLRLGGIAKVRSGETTLAEVLRVTPRFQLDDDNSAKTSATRNGSSTV